MNLTFTPTAVIKATDRIRIHSMNVKKEKSKMTSNTFQKRKKKCWTKSLPTQSNSSSTTHYPSDTETILLCMSCSTSRQTIPPQLITHYSKECLRKSMSRSCLVNSLFYRCLVIILNVVKMMRECSSRLWAMQMGCMKCWTWCLFSWGLWRLIRRCLSRRRLMRRSI